MKEKKLEDYHYLKDVDLHCRAHHHPMGKVFQLPCDHNFNRGAVVPSNEVNRDSHFLFELSYEQDIQCERAWSIIVSLYKT